MTRLIFLFGLLVVFLIAVGCAGPSRLEMDYGTSYQLAKFNQTSNPEAEKNLEPVTGFDGRAAKATIDRYQKGFERPPAAPVYTLRIGTLGTGVGTGAQY